MPTIDEERRKQLAIPSRSMQGQKPPTNMLSPTSVPPAPLRLPAIPPRIEQGVAPPQAGATGTWGAGATGEVPTQTPGESMISPYQNAYQKMGGGWRGAGGAYGQLMKDTFINTPLRLGNLQRDYTKAVYGGPAEFAAGAVGIGPDKAPPAPNAPPVAPVTQTAAPPGAAASTIPAATQPPGYFDAAQAEKTKAALAQPRVALPSDTVAPGGGSIQWNAMGRGTLDQLAPGQRDQFTRPGGMTITPDQASELAKRVQTVPAESFHRPMASTMEALSNARNAAMDRGDFNAVRRSYLSPADLQAENERIVEKRALSGRQQMLEARARDQFATPGNRRQAQRQLEQMNAIEAKAPDRQQQAFANQIAATNAQANVTRANAALNRPQKPQVRMMYETDPKTGENVQRAYAVGVGADGQPTLTPMDPRLDVKAANPPAPVDQKQRVAGQTYTAPDGRTVKWNGATWDVIE